MGWVAGGLTLVGQTNEPELSREDRLVRVRGNGLPNAVGGRASGPSTPLSPLMNPEAVIHHHLNLKEVINYTNVILSLFASTEKDEK